MTSAADIAEAEPPPEPVRRRLSLGPEQPDAWLAAIKFGDVNRPVDALFLHANGLTALTYRSVLAPLGERLHILAPDQAGHGRSPQRRAAEGRTDWLDLRDDLVAVIDGLEGGPLILAGHSMGATVALLAAAERPTRVKALALFEPVLMSRPLVGDNPFAAQARRRRAVFPSRTAAIDAYRGRGAFTTWPEDALRDYAIDGFRDRADGQVELACSPEWEASNFRAHGHDSLGALRRVQAPTLILRAERGRLSACGPSSRFSPTIRGLRVETIAGTTHFLPIERPALVAEALSALETF